MPFVNGVGQMVTYRHLYRIQTGNNPAVINLSTVDLSGIDTLLVDDTGATATTTVTLPKMGSFRAPIGMRLTLRKASTVAQTVTITPTTDVVSGAIGAYPSVAATTVLHLPASVPNNVTLEAMSLNATTGVEDPTVSPTVAGVWMNVASSVASV